MSGARWSGGRAIDPRAAGLVADQVSVELKGSTAPSLPTSSGARASLSAGQLKTSPHLAHARGDARQLRDGQRAELVEDVRPRARENETHDAVPSRLLAHDRRARRRCDASRPSTRPRRRLSGRARHRDPLWRASADAERASRLLFPLLPRSTAGSAASRSGIRAACGNPLRAACVA